MPKMISKTFELVMGTRVYSVSITRFRGYVCIVYPLGMNFHFIVIFILERGRVLHLFFLRDIHARVKSAFLLPKSDFEIDIRWNPVWVKKRKIHFLFLQHVGLLSRLIPVDGAKEADSDGEQEINRGCMTLVNRY